MNMYLQIMLVWTAGYNGFDLCRCINIKLLCYFAVLFWHQVEMVAVACETCWRTWRTPFQSQIGPSILHSLLLLVMRYVHSNLGAVLFFETTACFFPVFQLTWWLLHWKQLLRFLSNTFHQMLPVWPPSHPSALVLWSPALWSLLRTLGAIHGGPLVSCRQIYSRTTNPSDEIHWLSKFRLPYGGFLK